MSDSARPWARLSGGVFWAAVIAAIVYFVARYIGVFSNVVTVLLGFGAVVLVHEFGHFLVAKLAGIKVEAFSIFMPPTLVGIRRTKGGLKVRFLPSLRSGKGEPSAEPAEETEYRVGIFPFGGYVKLLGQEDTGPVKQIDDPRSFANKPVSARIAVVSAGVTFNIISAALVLMVVFLIGIRLPAPVAGGVVPDSPAAEAGIRAGDAFLEIDGQSKDLDFFNIPIAAALSDVGEKVPVTVRHQDGTVESMALVARDVPDSPLREFGIVQPYSLTIAPIQNPEVLHKRTGLLPGDRVVAVNGKKVEHYWDYAETLEETLAPTVQVTAERPKGDDVTEQVETRLSLYWRVARGGDDQSETTLSHVYSMVPRLLVAAVEERADGSAPFDAPELRAGDILLAAGQVECPTYTELRKVTTEHEGKPLPLKVLRADANGVEETVTLTVTPRRAPREDRAVIGFVPALDARHAVVAKTISTGDGAPALDLPRGARITHVNDRPVSSFHDIIEQVQQWGAGPVTLQYELDGRAEGAVTLPAGQTRPPVAVASVPAETLPFEPLEQLYRAKGPFDAIAMGYRRTVMFIAQTYVTLKQLLTGLLSPKNLMGPVGIISVSYRIVAEQPLINYAYFLGLIGATIAVLNFLPIPPFDGGLVVLMLIEKIRGAALSERAQGIVAYTGWIAILALLVYVTFNDIVRTFFS